MGPKPSAPVTITKHCGTVTTIPGSNENVTLKLEKAPDGCEQYVATNISGVKVTIPSVPVVVPVMLQNLAVSGIQLNQGVMVADATNTNPGVVIADQSDLYNNQPGVAFYDNTFENAGAKYYEAVLQNPGV